jgi:hypothetical protein
VLVVKVMSAGDADRARCLLRPLWDVAGPAIVDEVRPVPYARASMGGTPARYLDLVPALPDPVIRALVGANTGAHTDGLVPSVEIRHWGGAMAAAGPDAGPVGHRHLPFSIIMDADVPAVAATLRPYGSGGTFLNFVADPGRTASAYTAANLRRLRAVKAAYDPDNVFRVGHTIAPAGRPARAAAN